MNVFAALKDRFEWEREKRTMQRSTTPAYEEEYFGVLGVVVATLSVLVGAAAVVGLFALAVMGAA